MKEQRTEFKYPCQIWVIGDPITDVWITGRRDKEGRFHPEKTEIRRGGAANTYENIAALSSYSKVRFTGSKILPNKLIRMTILNQDPLQTTTFWDYFGHKESMYRLHPHIFRGAGSWRPHGLVISEYNKGTCNRQTLRELPIFEFAVVDSRYRTLDMSWLSTSKIKIWHATGKEFNDEWSNNFDYIIHTNGPNEVVLIDDKNHFVETLQVPDTKVVDTIGAGDTLTAAVAIYLAYEIDQGYDITFETIVEATQFAIWCCQDVITKPFTAVCSRTLEEYLHDELDNT